MLQLGSGPVVECDGSALDGESLGGFDDIVMCLAEGVIVGIVLDTDDESVLGLSLIRNNSLEFVTDNGIICDKALKLYDRTLLGVTEGIIEGSEYDNAIELLLRSKMGTPHGTSDSVILDIKAGNRKDNEIKPDHGMKLGYEVVVSLGTSDISP